MPSTSELVRQLKNCKHNHPSGTKRFAFTLNNPTGDERRALIKSCKAHSRFAVWQYEQAGTGTPHLQGYFEFRFVLTECQVRELLGVRRLYIKPAWATRASNIKYCTKTDSRLAEPVRINNSRSHKMKVSKVRAEAGRASGAVRKRRSEKENRRAKRSARKLEKKMDAYFASHPEELAEIRDLEKKKGIERVIAEHFWEKRNGLL